MIFTNSLIAKWAIWNRNRGVSVQKKFLSWLISTFKIGGLWHLVNIFANPESTLTTQYWQYLLFLRAWHQTIEHNYLLHFARYNSVIGTNTGISVGLIIDKASTHSNTHSSRYFANTKKRTESEVLNKKMNRFFIKVFQIVRKYWERTRVRD